MSNLLERIWETKHQNCLMFAYPQPVTENLIRWVDEQNPLHYNKNHFLAVDNLTKNDIQSMIEYQKQRKRHGFLLKSRNKLSAEMISEFSLQEEKQLIMALVTNKNIQWKMNSAIQIKDCQKEDIATDLMAACLSLTEDSAKQAWIRRTMEEALQIARINSNYHWLVAYQDNEVVGRAYAFEACGCVQMEDLWVAPRARGHSIGTTMMKYIREHFDGLYFLHTEASDSVKMMYEKLGFEVVDEVYEYSRVWRYENE